MGEPAKVKRRGMIAGVPVAYMIIWVAVFAVASVLPAIPLVGGGTFGLHEFILPVTGILFGPIGGLIAGTLGGILASFLGPGTAYFGLLTFYTHSIGAFAAGLLAANTRKTRLATFIIYAIVSVIWGLTAVGYYVYVRYAYWPMHLTTIVGILATPWAVRQIRTFDPKKVPVGVAILAWTAYMINHIAICIGWSLLYPEPGEMWVFAFMSGIVPAQRISLTIGTTIVGSACLVALYKAGVRFEPESRSLLVE